MVSMMAHHGPARSHVFSAVIMYMGYIHKSLTLLPLLTILATLYCYKNWLNPGSLTLHLVRILCIASISASFVNGGREEVS